MRLTHWQRIEELFEQAYALPTEARPGFLTETCGLDTPLRDELQAMLGVTGADHALAVERLVIDRQTDVGNVDPLLGTSVGPWRLVSVLGRGGMGAVYRAERADGQYRQEVAVKLVRSGVWDPSAIARFRTERQLLAQLVHPNIATLLDGGFAPDGTSYLVMELVDGVPITEWCASERLALEAMLRLFCVVCSTVQHAHRALVVHRDLKPSNIFVARSGCVKLLDFGIAKLLDPEAPDAGLPTTRAEMRLLTPEYAAPEQRRDGPVTTATDVYALGILLYELLTGVRPREPGAIGESLPPRDASPTPITAPSEALRRLAAAALTHPAGHEPPGSQMRRADARRLAQRIRGDLDRIVLMALRDEPDRRYGSAGQLGEEVERFLAGRTVLAQRDTLGYRTRKFVGRNRLAVTAAAVLVASLTVFGIIAAWQARALAEKGRVAVLERDKAEQVVSVLVDLFQTTNPAIRPDADRMPIGRFLAGAEARAVDQLSAAPLVRAKLKQVFGLIHYERGEYAPARAALEEALAEQRRLVGPDHPDALDSLLALGEVLHGAGHPTAAHGLLQEALDRNRRVYGDTHERTARARFALAPLVAVADLDAAEALLVQALDVRQRVLPQNHPDLALTFGALAESYRQRGDLARSRELYRRAFAVFRNPTERQHPRAVTVMQQYAALLGTLNAEAEAEAVLRDAIAVGERVLGHGTLTVAELTNSLAVTLATRGRHADAERAFRAAFEQHVALLGESHWRIQNIARNVGQVLAFQQRYREALPWMDRALAVRPEPPDDGGVESIRAQRAWIVFRLGRRAQALEEVARAVSALERMKDSGAGYRLAYSRVLLARILSEMGRPVAAESPARAARAWFARWGPTNPRYADAECELGRAQLLQGLTVEGRATLAQCLPVYRAWGLTDRGVVESIERLLKDPPDPSS